MLTYQEIDDGNLTELKRELYHALLVKDKDRLTDTEIEMMYNLALDDDIQKLLETRLNGGG